MLQGIVSHFLCSNIHRNLCLNIFSITQKCLTFLYYLYQIHLWFLYNCNTIVFLYLLQIHKDLNEKTVLNAGHFQIWLAYFNKTVDENFKGEFAEKIKVKALSIATVMQLKIAVKP